MTGDGALSAQHPAKLTADETAQIKAMVRSWPEPTPAQRARLIAILTQAGVEHKDTGPIGDQDQPLAAGARAGHSLQERKSLP